MAIPAYYSLLQRGSSGPDVALVQTWLNGVRDACTWYGELKTDGKFGISTENAVKEFQLKNKMNVDGKVGANTWNVLYTRYTAKHGLHVPYPGIALRSGSSGGTVRLVQQKLNSLGERLTADGRFGAATAAAVQRFQRRNGLNAWNAPEQRHQPARRRQSRTFQNRMLLGRDAEQAGGFWRFLTLRRGLAADLRSPRWWALCLTSPGDATARAAVRGLGRELLAAFPHMAAFVHEERGRADALTLGERRVDVLDATGRSRPEAARLHLPLLGRFFTLDVASFFQVNTSAAQILARTALDLLPEGGEELLDLYCGVGAPGLLLAPAFSRLYGVEQDARAVALARENAAGLSVDHCRYAAGDAALLLQERTATADMVLADPPRAGLAPAALAALLRLRPRSILYISCNPATLARDAALLREGYRLARLAAVDLFPHTPHVECLSLWQRL